MGKPDPAESEYLLMTSVCQALWRQECGEIEERGAADGDGDGVAAVRARGVAGTKWKGSECLRRAVGWWWGSDGQSCEFISSAYKGVAGGPGVQPQAREGRKESLEEEK